MSARTGIPPMTEKQFQALVVDMARTLGWLCFHDHDSRRSTPGFPDLVLVNERLGRVVFAELKTERGRESDAQYRWRTAINRATGRAYLWRPSDLPEVEAVLRGRA